MNKKAAFALFGLLIILLIVLDQFVLNRHNPTVGDRGAKNIIYRDYLRSYNGYNIRNQENEKAECVIIDMAGAVVKSFPGHLCQFVTDKKRIFSVVGDYLSLMDPLENIIWSRPYGRSHHDSFLDQENEVFYGLVWENHLYKGKVTAFSVVVAYDLKGDLVFRWSSKDHLQDIFQHIYPELRNPESEREPWMTVLEFIKVNSVSVFKNHPLRDSHPIFKNGNLLLSFRREGILAVIERETGKIVWSYQLHKDNPTKYKGAHSARIMKNGNLLFLMSHYKNNPVRRDQWYSGVVELDPVTKKEVWTYTSDPKTLFYGDEQGSVAELPNSNILITYSKNGTAFELTRAGRIVWEYLNVSPDEDKNILPMYRMDRLPTSIIEPFLKSDEI